MRWLCWPPHWACPARRHTWIADSNLRLDLVHTQDSIVVSARYLVEDPLLVGPARQPDLSVQIETPLGAAQPTTVLRADAGDLPMAVGFLISEEKKPTQHLMPLLFAYSKERDVRWFGLDRGQVRRFRKATEAYALLISGGAVTRTVAHRVLEAVATDRSATKALFLTADLLPLLDRSWFDKARKSGIALYPVFAPGEHMLPWQTQAVAATGGRFLPWGTHSPSLLEVAVAMAELRNSVVGVFPLQDLPSQFQYRLPFEAEDTVSLAIAHGDATTRFPLPRNPIGLADALDPQEWFAWLNTGSRRPYAGFVAGLLLAVAVSVITAARKLCRPTIAWISVERGRRKGIRSLPYTLGRGHSCDLVIDNPTVSRKHAEIRFDSGGLVLRDLSSKHGTFMDGVAVARSRLGFSQSVELGEVKLNLVLPEPYSVGASQSNS